MHTKHLIAAGETSDRLALLRVWRDAPSFTPRERAAFAWAEAVTQLGPHAVSDELYEQTLAEFGNVLLAQLSLAVVTINAWNRMGIAFRSPAGLYEPGAH